MLSTHSRNALVNAGGTDNGNARHLRAGRESAQWDGGETSAAFLLFVRRIVQTLLVATTCEQEFCGILRGNADEPGLMETLDCTGIL